MFLDTALVEFVNIADCTHAAANIIENLFWNGREMYGGVEGKAHIQDNIFWRQGRIEIAKHDEEQKDGQQKANTDFQTRRNI